MCPSAPFSVPLDINASSTDEELVLFLGGRKVGDPVPDNVITEVSPFSIEPWNSPEDMWYLFNPEDPQSLNGDCEFKVTRTGYWKSMDDLRILTSTPTVGRKTTREFYIGKAPHGNKTQWMMHEYQAEQKTRQGINIEQDHCSLCRVFLQIDERPNHEEQHNSIIADAADGDYLECVLLNLLAQEENNLSSRDAVNRSQMVGRDQQGQSVLSGASVTGPETDSSAEDVYATCDFSKGDYLELNDLYSPGTSSSSSDNSSLMSVNSDECFDADALLRDIENEHIPRVEEEHVDCRYSVSASIKSNQVVIRPPPGSVCRNSSSNLVVEGGTFANPIPERARTFGPSSSAYELSHNRKASTSGKSPGSHSDQSSSSSSCGSRTSQGRGSKTVGRIARLGKKYYCCFGSFQPDLHS
ncbi:NAC domain-containing protein JA2-like isoform X1 [Phoenix dactylifera]|uniref:NAC domain-containing protein JA2-like isoform X1 n=2 Tax=Phoenix dactylifera TaxID=42345 RepID=A0A8B7CU98_PHODC|nr:NAC domain-containing protein JA2-like isoform X1 [Phoenix dactylifera]